ncbi:hypothetical protein BU14_0112s0018, partial [Porphyra umbilicalis]
CSLAVSISHTVKMHGFADAFAPCSFLPPSSLECSAGLKPSRRPTTSIPAHQFRCAPVPLLACPPAPPSPLFSTKAATSSTKWEPASTNMAPRSRMQSQRTNDKDASRAAEQASTYAASTIARVTRSAAKMFAGSSGQSNTQAAASTPHAKRTVTKKTKGPPKTFEKAAAGVRRSMPEFAPVSVSDVGKPGDQARLLNEPRRDDGAATVATCSTTCASTPLLARADSGTDQLAAVSATLSPSSRLPRTRRRTNGRPCPTASATTKYCMYHAGRAAASAVARPTGSPRPSPAPPPPSPLHSPFAAPTPPATPTPTHSDATVQLLPRQPSNVPVVVPTAADAEELTPSHSPWRRGRTRRPPPIGWPYAPPPPVGWRPAAAASRNALAPQPSPATRREGEPATSRGVALPFSPIPTPTSGGVHSRRHRPAAPSAPPPTPPPPPVGYPTTAPRRRRWRPPPSRPLRGQPSTEQPPKRSDASGGSLPRLHELRRAVDVRDGDFPTPPPANNAGALPTAAARLTDVSYPESMPAARQRQAPRSTRSGGTPPSHPTRRPHTSTAKPLSLQRHGWQPRRPAA